MVKTIWYLYYKLKLLFVHEIAEVKTHNGVTYGLYRKGQKTALMRGYNEERVKSFINLLEEEE